MKRDFDEVYHELRRMGTGDDVYRLLKLKGIRGRVGEGKSCPVTNYIKSECGLTSVYVGSTIMPGYIGSADLKWGYETPTAVWDFISKFDDGRDYWDLNEESS